MLALHRYLLATPSRLRCLSLTDAVGERRTQNQPGTKDEYPNWRVPLGGPDGEPVLLEDVFTSQRAAPLAEAMRGDHGGRVLVATADSQQRAARSRFRTGPYVV